MEMKKMQQNNQFFLETSTNFGNWRAEEKTTRKLILADKRQTTDTDRQESTSQRAMAQQEAKLFSNPREREMIENMADLFSIIKTTQALERAHMRDATKYEEWGPPRVHTKNKIIIVIIKSTTHAPKSRFITLEIESCSRFFFGCVLWNRYRAACAKFITQYKTARKVTQPYVPDVAKFMKDYWQDDCEAALDRLESGVV